MPETPKKSIDKMRESSGTTEIGSTDDGAIIQSFNHRDKLIIVKTESIYEFVFADNIDPKRVNPKMPPTIQKKRLDKGCNSQLVSQTLLTTTVLVKPEFLESHIDRDSILDLSFELLNELLILEKEVNTYLELESLAIAEYNDRKEKQLPYALPTIDNLETRCKTIFQKSDHIEQILIQIIIAFYPNAGLSKQSYFSKFRDFLVKEYGDNDRFTQFVEKCTKHFDLSRNARNCLDHRLDFVTINDFELQVNSDVLTPTIQIDNYRKYNFSRTPLSEILPIIVENVPRITEEILAHLCDKLTKPGPLNSQVLWIPKERRKIYPLANYCFWSALGTDGYFHEGS